MLILTHDVVCVDGCGEVVYHLSYDHSLGCLLIQIGVYNVYTPRPPKCLKALGIHLVFIGGFGGCTFLFIPVTIYGEYY